MAASTEEIAIVRLLEAQVVESVVLLSGSWSLVLPVECGRLLVKHSHKRPHRSRSEEGALVGMAGMGTYSGGTAPSARRAFGGSLGHLQCSRPQA